VEKSRAFPGKPPRSRGKTRQNSGEMDVLPVMGGVSRNLKEEPK